MPAPQENSNTLTNPALHLEDDIMSESGSIISGASSSYLPLRIQKLVIHLACLEEEMVHTNLSEEEIIKVQTPMLCTPRA